MGLKDRLERLEGSQRPEPEDERERERLRREIREAAEHANRCARGGWRPFELTAEGVFCAADGRPVRTWAQTAAEEAYWAWMEFEAIRLARGLEPHFTLDEAGAFVTPGGGRFALGRERQDLEGLMGPRTRELQEAIDAAPERWARFLGAYAEADGALLRLLELAEGADVPEGYATPLGAEATREEAEAFPGTMKPFALFGDAAEKELVRRLHWTLSRDPRALGLLCELTRRRDAYFFAAQPQDLSEP